MSTTAASVSETLTRDETDRFRSQGFLGPYAICSPDEMAAIRAQIDRDVLPTQGPAPRVNGQSRHLDRRVVWDLCSHPAIVERMACLYGQDLILWRSNFFVKEPGDKEIPWHQDLNYWPIEPIVNITAWIAIDKVTIENACVELIPGSHRAIVPHVSAGDEVQFQEMADPAHVDTSHVVRMELEPGEFFLFTERLLHRSKPNRSDQRRLGLAVRVTVPFVKVEHDRLFRTHKNILLHGRDSMGINRMTDPPASGR